MIKLRSKNALRGLSVAVVLHMNVLAGTAQTNICLYSGSETNITLNLGTYIITAYGAPGGDGYNGLLGGVGAEMSGEFYFPASTTVTLLVGGGGSGPSEYGGGGGGGSFYGGGGGGYGGFAGGGSSFEAGGTGGVGFDNGGYGGGGGGSEYGAGDGGGYSGGDGGVYYENGGYGTGQGNGRGSLIDSSALTNLAEVSGIASPDDPGQWRDYCYGSSHTPGSCQHRGRDLHHPLFLHRHQSWRRSSQLGFIWQHPIWDDVCKR